jgi:integrase
MGILKRNNSPYWYVQFQQNGKTFIRSTKTADKKLAQQLEAKWRNDLIRSEYLGIKPSIRLDACIKQCLDYKSHLANIYNIARHGEVIKKRIAGNPYIHQITNRDVEKIHLGMKKEGYSLQTIKHILLMFKQSIDYSKKLGYNSPTLDYPKIALPKHKLRYLSVEEEKRLLEAIDPRRPIKYKKQFEERNAEFNKTQIDHYDLVVMLLDTGARFSEIATLPWEAINFEERSIRLWRPKVRNESILYMTDRVYSVLNRRIQNRTSHYVFSNQKGGSLNYTSHSFANMFKRAGLEGVTIHTLRHTHASRLVQLGLTIYDVKEVLGHSNIQTTMRYAHLERRDVTRRAKNVINALNQGQTSHESRTSANSDESDVADKGYEYVGSNVIRIAST